MSTQNHVCDPPEQICYVQCGFCTTKLMVSVPSKSLSTVVTVRCGHCTTLLSVNMMKTSLTHIQPAEGSSEEKNANKNNASMMTCSDCEEENVIQITNVVNKRAYSKAVEYSVHVWKHAPEKRQRSPSAYNCFIKEEIRRLKAQNPDMAHKEAFSTAAKNWANCPPSQCKEDQDSCSHAEQLVDLDSYVEPHDPKVNEEGQGFQEFHFGKDTV